MKEKLIKHIEFCYYMLNWHFESIFFTKTHYFRKQIEVAKRKLKNL